jgi:hypothetical protein
MALSCHVLRASGSLPASAVLRGCPMTGSSHVSLDLHNDFLHKKEGRYEDALVLMLWEDPKRPEGKEGILVLMLLKRG